ncbi:hypothetical protein ABES25_24070 [Bacillus gobiensis]|uniref:hypothetical protein n=1 Tax=Bacillus gobiensis TaxID=1441095 RepID=UPI003D223D94
MNNEDLIQLKEEMNKTSKQMSSIVGNNTPMLAKMLGDLVQQMRPVSIVNERIKEQLSEFNESLRGINEANLKLISESLKDINETNLKLIKDSSERLQKCFSYSFSPLYLKNINFSHINIENLPSDYNTDIGDIEKLPKVAEHELEMALEESGLDSDSPTEENINKFIETFHSTIKHPVARSIGVNLISNLLFTLFFTMLVAAGIDLEQIDLGLPEFMIVPTLKKDNDTNK